MWTTENRARYDRSRLRYPSDLTDDEWTWIRPLIPPAKRGGNKRTVVERDLMNGLMYILSTGCQWATETPCVNVSGIWKVADGRQWKAPLFAETRSAAAPDERRQSRPKPFGNSTA
jgi:transposase